MKLTITIDQKTYEVEVEASEPEPGRPRIPKMELAHARMPAPPPVPLEAASANERVCRSPVPGIVVRMAAHPGQTFEVGDLLLVLEAMKMENNINSPVAGKVAAIKVAVGDSVQAGQVMVEFEQ